MRKKIRFWIWERLIFLADRIAPEMAFRRTSALTFTFERNIGIAVHGADNTWTDKEPFPRGCPLWYHGPDYELAHKEGTA